MMYLNKRALHKLGLFFFEELPHDLRLGKFALNDLHVDDFMGNVGDASSVAVCQHHLQFNCIVEVLKLLLKVLKIEAVSKEYK